MTGDKVNYPTPARVWFASLGALSEAAPVPAAVPLPSGLVVAPGTYTVDGLSIAMTVEGLYVVSNCQAPADSNQRLVIVYQQSLDTLLSSISWLVHHGTVDDGTPQTGLLSTALFRRLIVTCGYASQFAQAVFNLAGVKNRLVGGLAAGNGGATPPGGGYDGYDDGHMAIEVWDGSKWRLFDPDNNVDWHLADGSSASLLDVYNALFNNGSAVSSRLLTTGAMCGAQSFNAAAWFLVQAARADLLAWYARQFQVPYMGGTGQNCTYGYAAVAQQSAVENYESNSQSFVGMPIAAWESTYYPAGS